MKRSLLLFLSIAFFVSLGVSAAPYDKDATVLVMRANVARMQTIKTAVAARDWNTAAQAFFDYAKAGLAEMAMDPPKGSKEDWITTWQYFVEQAYRGVGTCAEKDPAKILKALDDLVAVNKHGHSTFRF